MYEAFICVKEILIFPITTIVIKHYLLVVKRGDNIKKYYTHMT